MRLAQAEAVLRGQRIAAGGIRLVPTSSTADRIVASAANLLRLAHVDIPTRRRVEQIIRSVARVAPGLADVDELPWYLLLARQPWARGPRDWRPEGGSRRRQRDAFALHLLTRFPVPPFLVRALDVEAVALARVPVEDEWAVSLLSRLGQGVSPRSLVGSACLPAPLTRRMVRDFLGATASTEPIAALRTAQVVGLGGPRALARTLLRTRLGRLHGPDADTGEPFWQAVLAWVCARSALHGLRAEPLDQLLGWIEASQRLAVAKGASWSLKGRTADSALRDAADWSAHRASIRGEVFPPSGLLPLDEAPVQYRNVLTSACARIDRERSGGGAKQSERLLPPARRAAVLAEYAKGNRAVAKRYFGRRDLFLEPLPDAAAPLARMELPADSYALMRELVTPLIQAVISHQKEAAASEAAPEDGAGDGKKTPAEKAG